MVTESSTTAKTTGSLRAMRPNLKNNNNEHLPVASLRNEPEWTRHAWMELFFAMNDGLITRGRGQIPYPARADD